MKQLLAALALSSLCIAINADAKPTKKADAAFEPTSSASGPTAKAAKQAKAASAPGRLLMAEG